MIQRVIFYREPIEPNLMGGEIIAVFPDQPYKEGFDATHICYKNGSFMGICPDYLNCCKLATRGEYRNIETELTFLGYSLAVLNFSLEFPLNT